MEDATARPKQGSVEIRYGRRGERRMVVQPSWVHATMAERDRAVSVLALLIADWIKQSVAE